MAQIANPSPRALTADFARLYRHVHAIEDKIRRAHPEATFDMFCAGEDELQLYVFSDAPDPRAAAELVEDEQEALQDDLGIALFVVGAESA